MRGQATQRRSETRMSEAVTGRRQIRQCVSWFWKRVGVGPVVMEAGMGKVLVVAVKFGVEEDGPLGWKLLLLLLLSLLYADKDGSIVLFDEHVLVVLVQALVLAASSSCRARALRVACDSQTWPLAFRDIVGDFDVVAGQVSARETSWLGR